MPFSKTSSWRHAWMSKLKTITLVVPDRTSFLDSWAWAMDKALSVGHRMPLPSFSSHTLL